MARNIKTIRKELKCTQSSMSSILKVGFRTYVRYEAGERDAPVSVLVKLANMGNLSLEHLLTREVEPYNITPIQALLSESSNNEIKSADFQMGQICFRKPIRERLMTIDDSEKKLIAIFRKMQPEQQNLYLDNMNDFSALKRSDTKQRGRPAKENSKNKTSPKIRQTASTSSTSKPAKTKKRGRPGRKKIDKKILKEKIDKLKMITRSINKITVR
ncbi:MAG: helix-turn-helix domain-containing protein [Nitrospinales bacterium]